MRLRSSSFPAVVLCALSFASIVSAQQTSPTPKPGTAANVQLPVDRDPVASPDDVFPGVPPAALNPATQPNTTVVPSTKSTGEIESHGNQYLLRKNVDEVTLHATVVDQKQRLITGLDRDSFTVFEDGVQQKITSFRHEDIPVAIGVLIDNSGSMRDKRPSVNQAALDLVKASNPQDQVFIVNFSDEAFIDQDFTSSVPLLQEALSHVDSRGGTALYDAVMASAEYLSKNAKLDKQVLVVVTDGEDNASLHTLEEAVHSVQNYQGPVIYSIGILGGERERRARRALEALSFQTGGVAFFPKDASEVDQIATAVAHDIRNQYTIQYKSTKAPELGGYRTIKVIARPNTGKTQLSVRTRSGYYPGQEKDKGERKVSQRTGN